jgi:hypothetical protein
MNESTHLKRVSERLEIGLFVEISRTTANCVHFIPSSPDVNLALDRLC